jgi:hypothetical protein
LKHFLNHDLLAPNVLTIPVEMEIVSEFAETESIAKNSGDYYSVAPWTNINDIRWISAQTPAAFGKFQSAFERLNIANHFREYLDIDKKVQFYAGFLHVRSNCAESNFHVDWIRTNNEGFTLLTPVSGLETGPRLLYKKLTGEIAEYRYKAGEAIVFGDHFIHSTPPGKLNPPFTLLVFNFGTDKMEHWDKLKATQGRQCPLVRRPDGTMITIDPLARA